MRCLLLLTLLLLPSCAAPAADLVVRNVAVIDVSSGTVVEGQTVVVDGGQIVEVGTQNEFNGRGITEIDGSGKFVMPGLIDAHVHVDHRDELNIYPAFGVTSIFVLRGLPQHLLWKSEIGAGTRFGPRLFTTGDYMDGYPPYMQPLMSFDDVESARQSVREQEAAGYDFVKIFTRLSSEQHAAIVDETHLGGRCVVGHANPNVTLPELVMNGQDNIAHGQDLIRWYFESADDPDGIERVVGALAGSNTTVTANLSWTAGLLAQGTNLDALLARPVARALHPAILQPFRRDNNRFVGDAEEWVPEVQARFEIEKALTKELRDAGVILLAGTDASTSGVFPGDAIHIELEQLVAAGLTPAQALAAATTNAADFLSRCVDPELKLGRVAVDHRADLVLLSANPLDDIGNTRQISGVVLDGQWFPSDMLQSTLDALDRDYVGLREQVIELERALFSGRTKEARRIFDEARAERPGEILFSQYTPFFVGFGFLYEQNGFNTDPERLKAALDLYRMYVETYPQFHSAHYQLALAQQANGMIDEARASLEQALEIHPWYPDARRRLAEMEN
ncbi:MAG: amidohydrolase family protein [Gemmatimonadota bacterium]|nr:amidohydrolase family protein [Gemmatimonadota bacterium]